MKQRILDAIEVDRSGCWLWTLGRTSRGYGSLKIDGVAKVAHRESYEAFRGPIPPGLHIDHLCRVRHCVNPDTSSL